MTTSRRSSFFLQLLVVAFEYAFIVDVSTGFQISSFTQPCTSTTSTISFCTTHTRTRSNTCSNTCTGTVTRQQYMRQYPYSTPRFASSSSSSSSSSSTTTTTEDVSNNYSKLSILLNQKNNQNNEQPLSKDISNDDISNDTSGKILKLNSDTIMSDANEKNESDIISFSKAERPVLKEGYLESLLENDVAAAATISTSTSTTTSTTSTAATTAISTDAPVPQPLSSSSSSSSSEPFQNEGPFAWMQPFLDTFGYKEGYTTNYGAPKPLPPSSSTIVISSSTQQQQQQQEKQEEEKRQYATKTLTNIGMDERERRKDGSIVMTYVTVVYAIVSSVLFDQGDLEGHFLRFGILLPLFFTDGLKKSADSGLWNLAQSGRWDVDGTGIRDIQDPNLARAILEKVNAMNLQTGRDVILLSAIFAILPQSLTSTLGIWSALFGALYLLNGKIPQEKEE